jgi:hypothetical protein
MELINMTQDKELKKEVQRLMMEYLDGVDVESLEGSKIYIIVRDILKQARINLGLLHEDECVIYPEDSRGNYDR